MSDTEERRDDPSDGKSGASPSGPGTGLKPTKADVDAARRAGGGGKEEPRPGKGEPVRDTPPPDLPFGGD
jgi:hypothetical protein